MDDAEIADDAALEAEAAVFEEWMRTGAPSPQVRLRVEVHHSDVRREARAAANARSQSRGTLG